VHQQLVNGYIEKILKARVYEVAVESPLDYARRLSERLQRSVYLKREDMQPVFSFKLRGAYNRIVHLDEAQKQVGVIAASAGNHAQGVAYSARELGIPCLIVMPKTTPKIKVEAVRALGGKIRLHGDSYDLAEEKGMTYIHPFDDPLVIAGQGTIAMEILRQSSEPPAAIFVPVGGGGLIAGIAAYVKYLYPEVRVIGVEPEDAPTLDVARRAGEPRALSQVGIFADGVAVRLIGKETFRLARHLVDDVVLVSSDEICAAIKDIFDETRVVAEPAGALAVAGLKRYLAEGRALPEGNLVAIQSGANVNFDRLRHVAERAELGERREALLAVEIPERPGSFLRFARILGRKLITEFNYRYSDHACAQVFVGVRLEEGEAEKQELVQRLVEKGFSFVDMTDNEMAKLHVRYMVGGHAVGVEDEMVVRFEFPERPGALLDFLTGIGGRRWNISLFHYRNHGAAYGRVLMGIQVPEGERGEFFELLQQLGYRYWDESGNPAYRLFVNALG
jgi:threonine dehydratase